MESRRDVFQAIADPTRRAILTLLAAQALTPGAIADNFQSARQTISRHIQILTECELLTAEQNGRAIYYHINAKQMKKVADFLEPFRKTWDDKFNKLETLVNPPRSKLRGISGNPELEILDRSKLRSIKKDMMKQYKSTK